jgi:tetratricopeptide (TPR) repeat protein
MRKLFALVLLLLCTSVASAQAPLTSSQAREAEWKSYALPQTNFTRRRNPGGEFIFRIPADWKEEGTLTFNGPHSARIAIFTQKIPDGYPLKEYFTSLIRVLKDQPDTGDAILTRKTQLQDLEARELLIETPNPDGEIFRRTTWLAVYGPLALTFNLQVPIAHAADIEPFFKAVVQSVMFLPGEHVTFEELRATTLNSIASHPVNEVENIVASLNELDVDREAAVTRLTPLFSTVPEMAVDLLIDRRPLVRAAAVEALARSNNSKLQPLVWEMTDDREPFAAAAAARSVAGSPDLIAKILRYSSSGQNIETIARIWPFMTKEKRIELLQKVFSKPATPRSTATSPKTKTDVKVMVTELAPVKPGGPVPDVTVGISNDPNVQIGVLPLLATIPVEDFKLPLTQLMASNYDPLIAIGLQVAIQRRESLPVDTLIKLAGSSDKQVSQLAAESLGMSAGVADVPRIEALMSKGAKKDFDEELKLSIKRIQFRHELAAAKSPNESRQIINKTLSDPALSGFAWLYDCEATTSGCGPTSTLKSDFAPKPFGENLFPKKVRHFTAIPSLGQATQKFYESLKSLQMDSPRAQANVVLVLNNVREMIANEWSAPAEAETVTEYTGIDLKAPIALASWTADKALDSTPTAQRQAIVLRVKDRARFERLVDQFQESTGSFTKLTNYVGIGTRALAAMPAFLPLIAQAIIEREPSKDKREPLQRYSVISDHEWNGLKIRTIEYRWISSEWEVDTAVSHIVYLDDYAIITSDLATIRDLVARANSPTERQTLAENDEFRKIVERRGEIVYFSDLKAIGAEFGIENKDFNFRINESGALNIGNSTWENTHQLAFDESDWSKHLLPFHPKDLTAPRTLLPASTIAYYLMNLDLALSFSDKIGTFFPENLQSNSKLWGIDFQKEVLPELGPECGAVLLELPSIKEFSSFNPTWATFCKLKTNKLAEALSTGKLFNGIGPAKDFAEVKNGNDSYFFAVRSGFLIFSNREKGVAAFDGKSSLVSTRDYEKAVEKVPGGIVAFGGYNLEAAIAAASKTPLEGLEGQIANSIFSIARAFHSQNFYATAARGTVEGKSSVAMDREGRYSFADFASLTKGTSLTLATVEPSGAPITDQNRLSSLVLRMRAKSAGPIENVKEDIKTADQTVEQKSAQELILTVAARRAGTEKAVALPVKDPEFAADLKATAEFPANNENVKKQASEIAGDDRDAWSVARKLADWTHQNLEWKKVDSADAAQTLATREADCSEFSALFVAMARSLGLPARIVSGLAYSGDSFGGHAWVEVWAGRWIELDPTWGTHFVDATHIRNTSSALVTSAALNLFDFEVLETRRTVEDFQKSSKALAQHLITAIPAGNRSELEAVIDVATLTDEFMGTDAWNKMNEVERNQMSSAYRRALNEIMSYSRTGSGKAKMSLLHLEEKGNAAEAICSFGAAQTLLKLRLILRNERWYLVEVLQSDTNLHSVAETIRPVVAAIESARAGKRVAPGLSDVVRVMLLMQSDSAKAVALADTALKTKPGDPGLRLLKARALSLLEKDDEANSVLRELSKENFAPAVYVLASSLDSTDDEVEKKEAVALYEQYVRLEPYDTRGLHDLAGAYNNAKDYAKAEGAYRKLIALEPTDADAYVDLVSFLVVQDRPGDVGPVLAAADKNTDTDADVFGEVMDFLTAIDESGYATKFAASEPKRMKTSSTANFYLGRMYSAKEQYALALKFLQTAADLDKEWDEPYITMSLIYRQQSRFAAALRAADQAIAIDDEDGEAHYERACALARLGRLKEAMSALEKAIELYPVQADWMAEEKDLQALSKLPAFKKLLPQPEKQ